MNGQTTIKDDSVAARWAAATSSMTPLVVLLVVLTGARIVLLTISAMEIQVDEAQYWDWSRHLAFGYYSKPPLIAWTIAAAGAVCGSSEACIRLPAALFYFVTPLLIYAIGRALYDRRVAFWAAVGFAFAPGVSFSSQIMSTDVLLLFLWALALLAFIRLRAGGDWRWAILLGVALGFGLLAKYAMMYFVGCALVASVFDRQSRATVKSPRFWIAVVIGLAMLAPNLIWNAQNGFITFRHTGDNISGGPRFDPLDSVGFFLSQFAVIGPFLFGGMLVAAYSAWRKGSPAADRLMLAFALPIIVVIVIAGCFNSANANWGAAAFVSTAVIASAFMVRIGRTRLLEAGIAIGVAAQIVIFVGATFADKIYVPFLKHGDLYNAVLGRRVLADHLRTAAQASGATTIIAVKRNEAATLNYYLRDDRLDLLVWPDDPSPDDHFELTRSVVDHPPAGVSLLLSNCVDTARLAPYFGDVRQVDLLAIASGPTSQRHYKVFRLDKIHPPLGTVPLCDRKRDGDRDPD